MEWKHLFEEKILDRGRVYVSEVKNLKKINDKITCTVSGTKDYYVTATIIDDDLKNITCNCPYPFNCKHEVALLYCLEENRNEIEEYDINNEKDSLETLVNHIDPNTLKKFFKKELKINDKLKEDFLNEFKDKKLVDKTYYENIIDGIFENGKGRDFNLHGYYNLDYIENSILKFLDEEIQGLISLGEEDIVCDLLTKIMDEIDDDIYLNDESWFNIAEEYQEYALLLLNTDKLNEFQRNNMEYHLSKTIEFI